MNKILSSFVVFCLIVSTSFADCDWSQIKSNPDGTYTYSKELNLCVGKLVKDSANKDQQISDLTKAISLKDLALQSSDQRAQTWMTTSGQLEDRLQKVDSLEKKNEWLYFGLGVATTFLAGITAAKLSGH